MHHTKMFLYTTLYSMPLYNGRIVAILQSAQPWSATIALGAPHAHAHHMHSQMWG